MGSDSDPVGELSPDGDDRLARFGPIEDSTEGAQLVEALLLLGRLLLASGDAVSDINVQLRSAARSWGAPDAQFIVLPNLMMASFDPQRPAHIMSRDLAADHLRLDQVIKVMHLARQARLGKIAPGEAIDQLHEIENSKLRRPILPEVLGTVTMTFGVALLFRPDDATIPLYLGLGALVGLIQAFSNRVPGLSAIMPVVIAFIASVIAFAVTGSKYDSAPIEALIPALTILLPGALLTMSAIDLASGEVVSGSSRFLEGMLQLALLAFGIFAAASLLGVHPSSSEGHGSGFASWVPWLGVLVFAAGVSLREAAPLKMFPWLLVVLYLAHSTQLLGDALFGPILSGFFAALVVVPVVQYFERFKTAPPAFALFLPAFLMLVPGALGLLGVSELASIEPTNGIGGLVSAISAILSIALGILVGTRVMRIIGAARSARQQLQQSIKLPTGWPRP
ncbi:MAG: threonine/serine exporter family protein [Solirubrobacterales bacterium]